MPKTNILHSEGGSQDLESTSDSTKELAAEIKKIRKKRTKREIKLDEIEQTAKELEGLFQPENFKPLVSLPGETGFALTGWEGWLLSDEEKSILASSASACAKYWLSIDPKYVALILFSFNLAQIYGSRAIAYSIEKKRKGGKAEKKTQ